MGPPIAPAQAGRNGGTNQTAQPETRPKPVCRDALYVVGAICAVSAGTALFIAIIVEVTGRMVLLIPRAWNRAKAEGRAEGLAEGRALARAEVRARAKAEGRAKERDRVRAILSQYGRRDPETGHLVLDQDAVELLRKG